MTSRSPPASPGLVTLRLLRLRLFFARMAAPLLRMRWLNWIVRLQERRRERRVRRSGRPPEQI